MGGPSGSRGPRVESARAHDSCIHVFGPETLPIDEARAGRVGAAAIGWLKSRKPVRNSVLGR